MRRRRLLLRAVALALLGLAGLLVGLYLSDMLPIIRWGVEVEVKVEERVERAPTEW
jgi:hypothetical protein